MMYEDEGLALVLGADAGLTLPDTPVLRHHVAQSVVFDLVFPEVHLLTENLPTVGALKALPSVKSFVYFFVLFEREGLSTIGAVEGLLSSVYDRVSL